MEEKEIQEWRDKIVKMSQEDMARLYRFAPSGHPVFNTSLPLNKYFDERFEGFTSAISKKIGWG